jgi:predicted component of type VI protein secretion system
MRMSTHYKNFGLLIIFTSLIFLSGCASRLPEDYSELVININSDQVTNGGTSFYAIVKADSDNEYINASYSSLHDDFLNIPKKAKVFITPAENTSIKSSFIFKKSDEISVYFMFSHKGSKNWKYRINGLSKGKIFNFILGRNSIKKVETM